MSVQKNPLWKIIITDIAGVFLLILVPIIGPLPGPGGIPLLLTGLGLLSINHERPQRWLHYARKHSKSVRDIVFPDITWVKWSWDAAAFLLLVGGTWLNFAAENWFWKGISIGVMASSTTLFMLNRDRIAWLDNKIRRK